MKKMYGVVTAMTTPFLPDGNVDFDSLEEQVEFLIGAGVHCLYPCGTTGEMLFMTAEQREAVVQAVVRKAAGRAIVYIHVGAVRQEDTIRLAKHAADIGADGIGVVTPSFFGLTERELITFYKTVSASVPADFPIYLYNIPQCSTNDIPVSVCEAVAGSCINVVGIKYSFADVHRTLDYLTVRGGDFSVLVGFDRLLLPALTMGCDGTVSGASSVFPEPFVAGYNAYVAGDYEQARAQMMVANDIVNKLRAGSRLSIFKAVQKMRGLRGGLVHAPLLEVDADEYQALQAVFAPYFEMYPIK